MSAFAANPAAPVTFTVPFDCSTFAIASS